MKKPFVALVTLLSLSPVVFALHAPDWNGTADVFPQHALQTRQLRVRLEIGMLEGESREIVYYDDSFGRQQTLSELIWDLSGLYLGGVSASWLLPESWNVLSLPGRFSLNAGYWTALNKGSGQMNDYDWLYEGLPWSDWSLSDVDVLSADLFDLNVTAPLITQPGFQLRAMLGFKHMFFDWSDYGIEYIYSYYGFRDQRGDFGGENLIDYEQSFYLPYAGVVGVVQMDRVQARGYIVYTPIGWADDKDHHIARDLIFVEDFTGVEYMGMGGEITYTTARGVMLSGMLDYQHVPEVVGDMTITDLETGETYFERDAAGISHRAVSARIAIGWAF